MRRSHPDFHVGGRTSAFLDLTADGTPPVREVAVDFVEMSVLLDRVQAAFFRDAL